MTQDTGFRRLLLWAATLSVAAAVLHAMAAPEHFEEWWGYGLFFLVAAAAQGLYGVIILLVLWQRDEAGRLREAAGRYERPYCMAGIVGNAAVIALYLVTRTAGIPFFGPDAGMVEPVTLLSVASKVVEVVLVVCLFALLRRTSAAVLE